MNRCVISSLMVASFLVSSCSFKGEDSSAQAALEGSGANQKSTELVFEFDKSLGANSERKREFVSISNREFLSAQALTLGPDVPDELVVRAPSGFPLTDVTATLELNKRTFQLNVIDTDEFSKGTRAIITGLNRVFHPRRFEEGVLTLSSGEGLQRLVAKIKLRTPPSELTFAARSRNFDGFVSGIDFSKLKEIKTKTQTFSLVGVVDIRNDHNEDVFLKLSGKSVGSVTQRMQQRLIRDPQNKCDPWHKEAYLAQDTNIVQIPELMIFPIDSEIFRRIDSYLLNGEKSTLESVLIPKNTEISLGIFALGPNGNLLQTGFPSGDFYTTEEFYWVSCEKICERGPGGGGGRFLESDLETFEANSCWWKPKDKAPLYVGTKWDPPSVNFNAEWRKFEFEFVHAERGNQRQVHIEEQIIREVL